MKSQPELSGAGSPMLIGGKEFLATVLTEKDYDEIDEYIQFVVVNVAKRQLVGLTSSERQELLQAAIKAAASTGWGTPEGGKIINSQEGSFRLGWQMTRKNHPKVSFEEFLQIAKSDVDQSREEIDRIFGKLHFANSEESQEDSSNSSKSGE